MGLGPARSRWNTKFSRWVRDFTVPRVAGSLNARGYPVVPHTIYGWVYGRHYVPPPAAVALERISRGKVTLQDIYRHTAVVRRPARSSADPSMPPTMVPPAPEIPRD